MARLGLAKARHERVPQRMAAVLQLVVLRLQLSELSAAGLHWQEKEGGMRTNRVAEEDTTPPATPCARPRTLAGEVHHRVPTIALDALNLVLQLHDPG